jgi:hypothetical protein
MHTSLRSQGLRGGYHAEGLDVDGGGGMVLECILGNCGWGCGLGVSGSGWGPVAGSRRHGDEPSDSMEVR